VAASKVGTWGGHGYFTLSVLLNCLNLVSHAQIAYPKKQEIKYSQVLEKLNQQV
jgi:hypothetical protein